MWQTSYQRSWDKTVKGLCIPEVKSDKEFYLRLSKNEIKIIIQLHLLTSRETFK